MPGIPEDMPLSLRYNLWFQNYGVEAVYGEGVWQWLRLKVTDP
jgi:hypothetical protein